MIASLPAAVQREAERILRVREGSAAALMEIQPLHITTQTDRRSMSRTRTTLPDAPCPNAVRRRRERSAGRRDRSAELDRRGAGCPDRHPDGAGEMARRRIHDARGNRRGYRPVQRQRVARRESAGTFFRLHPQREPVRRGRAGRVIRSADDGRRRQGRARVVDSVDHDPQTPSVAAVQSADRVPRRIGRRPVRAHDRAVHRARGVDAGRRRSVGQHGRAGAGGDDAGTRAARDRRQRVAARAAQGNAVGVC